MENYEEAHKCRLLDIEILLKGESQRGTAAAHLGGVAVECRLKALILIYHNISTWEEKSKRSKDSKFGQPIKCTGHGLIGAVRLMQDVYQKAKADNLFLKHLQMVTHPIGSTSSNFIDLRYSAENLTGNTLNDWQSSFQYVMGWLKKNEALI